MQITIDKQRVIEVWKKCSVKQQPLTFIEFNQSLKKLAICSLAF
jgi:hypothetical protein